MKRSTHYHRTLPYVVSFNFLTYPAPSYVCLILTSFFNKLHNTDTLYNNVVFPAQAKYFYFLLILG